MDELSINHDKFNISVDNGIMYSLVDQYLSLHPELVSIDDINKSFLDMINYMSRIYRVDINDIPELNQCFNSFCVICERYNYIPTLEVFCRFINTPSFAESPESYLYAAFVGQRKKASPELISFIKLARAKCKGALINTLTQTRGGDINRIFVAKAVYGLAETQPQTVDDVQSRGADDLLQGLGIGCGN